MAVQLAQAVDGGNPNRQRRGLGDWGLIALAYSPERATPINRTFLWLYHRVNPGQPPPQIAAQACTAYQVILEAVRRLLRRGGFEGLTLAQARAALMAELLAGRYDTPLSRSVSRPMARWCSSASMWRKCAWQRRLIASLLIR